MRNLKRRAALALRIVLAAAADGSTTTPTLFDVPKGPPERTASLFAIKKSHMAWRGWAVDSVHGEMISKKDFHLCDGSPVSCLSGYVFCFSKIALPLSPYYNT